MFRLDYRRQIISYQSIVHTRLERVGSGLNPIRPGCSQTEEGGFIEFCESQHYDICIHKVSHYDIIPGSLASSKF